MANSKLFFIFSAALCIISNSFATSTSSGSLELSASDPRNTQSLPYLNTSRANFSYTLDTSFDAPDGVTKYGIHADLEFGSNASNDMGGTNLEEAYLFFKKPQGSMFFGLQNPVTSKFLVNSSTFINPESGIAGQWYRYTQYPIIGSGAGFNPTFITHPFMPLKHGFTSSLVLHSFGQTGSATDYTKPYFYQPRIGWGEGSPSISFISKRSQSGFKFAMSYIPTNDDRAIITTANLNDQRDLSLSSIINNSGGYYAMSDIFAIAINHLKEFGSGVTIASSFLSEIGNYTNLKNVTNGITSPTNTYQKRHAMRSYSLGSNINYLGFTAGGSFGYYGNSFYYIKDSAIPANTPNYTMAIDNNGTLSDFNKSYFYDFGTGYSFGRYSFGASYFYSTFMNNRFSNLVISSDVKLSKNLTQFISFSHSNFQTANYYDQNLASIIKNPELKQNILMLGIKYTF